MGDREQPSARQWLDKAREREHVLEAVALGASRWREVLETVAEAEDPERAGTRLSARFGLDRVQAQAVLSLQVRRLPAGERAKIERELAELRTQIAELEREVARPAD